MTIPKTLPRTVIAALPRLIGERVRVCGFAEAIRDQKRMRFIVLRDGSGKVQLAQAKQDDEVMQALTGLTPESALVVTGRVVAAPAVRLGGLEIAVEAVEIVGRAEAPLPIAPESGLEKWLDLRQISLRFPAQRLAFAVQTTLEAAMRDFWCSEGFLEIHSPKLMGTSSESGAEVFAVGYFGRTAYLAQSPQFYKQMAIAGGLEKVFEIGPAFRAEPSFTARHETEFTSIDMEIAWIEDHHDLMALEERWLTHALAAVAREHGEAIRQHFGVELVVPTLPFPKLGFEEAQVLLAERGLPSQKPDDLDSDSEHRLAELMRQRTGHEFLFLTDYPAASRAFYHRRHPDRPALTRGFDLLWRGLEVTTGAQREHRYDRLVE